MFKWSSSPSLICFVSLSMNKISMVCFCKLIIFSCGVPTKLACAYISSFIINEEINRIKHFSSQKNDVIFHFFNQIKGMLLLNLPRQLFQRPFLELFQRPFLEDTSIFFLITALDKYQVFFSDNAPHHIHYWARLDQL